MGLKINFSWNNANKTVKGFNGFWASFSSRPSSLSARLNFHHISITSSSKRNQIRFFMTRSGPLKRIMMHRIYDNLFVKIVAKKGSLMQHQGEQWNWKGNCDPLPQMGRSSARRTETGCRRMKLKFHTVFTFFSVWENPKHKWPIMTKVRDGGIFFAWQLLRRLGEFVSDVFICFRLNQTLRGPRRVQYNSKSIPTTQYLSIVK